MLQRPGLAKSFDFHRNVVANGNGNALESTEISNGSFSWLTVQILGITTATVNFECSNDGTNYVALELESAGASATKATSTAANGIWRGMILGFKFVRMRISGWSSGTVSVFGWATA